MYIAVTGTRVPRSVYARTMLCNDLFRYNRLRTLFFRKGVTSQSMLRTCHMHVVLRLCLQL